MPSAQPSHHRTFWIGVGCAITVLLILTSFILIARVSAKGHLNPFDIAFVRFVFSGLIALPLLFWRGGWLLAQRLALQRGAALVATAGTGYCSFAYSGFDGQADRRIALRELAGGGGSKAAATAGVTASATRPRLRF